MRNIVYKFIFYLCFATFVFVGGCVQNITVQIPTHSPITSDSQLSLHPPQNIYLKSVTDSRTPGRAEGSREAAFGVPMGNVAFNPPASEIVRDVISAELKNAGHSVVDKEQEVNVAARILAFEVGTKTTPLYWDIVGMTKIEVEVMSLSENVVTKTYNSACQDRTYVWPSAELIKEVMLSCVSGFATAMRNDTELSQAIKDISHK